MNGFREGDTLIGRFAGRVRFARVTFLDRHSDALCFVDRDGRLIEGELADFYHGWNARCGTRSRRRGRNT